MAGAAPAPAAAGGLRVGDLVSVARVRPVVRLRDLADPELGPGLAAAFVLTEDAQHVLTSVAAGVEAGRGRGYLLEGNFGAGKSHLMAVLLGLAGGAYAPAHFGPGAAALEPFGPSAGTPPPRPLPVGVSLLDYAARRPLEEVVAGRIAEALGSGPVPGGASRRAAFDALAARARERGHAGLLVCLDELSEFLRAKPDGRAFAEDARFLQFLGEWAESAPAWVLLSVQEAVEDAGAVPGAVSGGLRDRYAVRFRLGAEHVRDLIARRLIRRRPGAEGHLARIAADLARTFGAVPGGSAEALARCYPVHPLTIDLLDRLRPLVSERRGVVDFVAARLAGDPARRIPPWLDQPAERLLCPDALVDHFRDRARERPETAPLITRALEHFERDLPRLLPDPEAAGLGLRIGKVLIAGALCPTPAGFTAAELALALLHPFTAVDPSLNAAFTAEAADAMAAAGAYVARSDPPAPAGHSGAQPGAGPLGGAPAPRYRCDLRAELGPLLQARLERWRAGLGPGDARLWTALLPWCDDPALPLRRLAAADLVPWDLLWRATPRRAATWVPAEPGEELAGPERLRDLLRRIELGEPDALVVLAAGPAGWGGPPDLRQAWRQRLAPAARGLHPDAAALLWLPRPPSAAEAGALADLAAHALLAAELEGDRSEAGMRLARHLRVSEPDLRRRAGALHAALFLEGEVLDAHGNAARPAEMDGPLPFSALLERLCDAPLRRRFPEHPDLPAGAGALPPAAIARAAAHLAAGDGAAPAPDPDAAAALERLLVPLGVCARDARGYLLCDGGAAGPHAARLLRLLAASGATPRRPVPLAEAQMHLRKGPGGLGPPLFEALCLTLVRAGAVSAVRDGRRLAPGAVGDLQRLRSAGGLCAGALLAADLRPAFRGLPLLPEALRQRPLTHGVQRQAWEAVCAWKRRWSDLLPGLAARAERLQGLPLLASALGAERLDDLRRLEGLLAEAVPGLGAAEGLARLLRAFGAEPAPGRVLAAAEALRRLVDERADAYLEARGYLEAPDFEPPAGLAAEAARLRRELADPAAPLGDGWDGLQERFLRLRQAYADAYAAAHAEAAGPLAFADRAAALAGPCGRLVRALEDRGLRVPEGEALARAGAALAAARCPAGSGQLAERLRRAPACPCGFRPGRPPDLPGAESIAAWAAEAAAAALRLAQARLAPAAEGGDPGAAALAALDPAAPDAAERALACLPAVGEGAWALGPPAARDIGRLSARLLGRSWARADLLAAVEDWLGGAPRVAVAAAPPAGAGSGGAPPEPPRPPDASARWNAARAALRAAAGRPPAAAGEWEALWLGPAGCWARRLEEAADALGGAEGRRAAAAWRAEAAPWAAVLAAAFRRDLNRWPEARAGLAPVGRALDAAGAGGGAVFAFCVDALRPDLLEAILDEAAGAGIRRSAAGRGLAWAVAPTVTAAQFEAWAQAGWGVQIAAQDAGAADAVAVRGRAALLPAAWAGGRWVCKWGFLDARLHAGDAGAYGTFCAEFRVRVRRLLLPALAALGPGDRAVLFGDHGFRQAAGGGYAHGGDSPDEVLTPWCVLE